MKKMVMAIMAGAMMVATAVPALAATPRDEARLERGPRCEQSYSASDVSREDTCCGGGYGRGGRGGYGGCYGYYDGNEER
ncbi:MAG: hypothetical protein IJT82_07150 [Schwartzia sp.]|nr:hypothetical protein [Schwartzia sp. (in: firmicutes)]